MSHNLLSPPHIEALTRIRQHALGAIHENEAWEQDLRQLYGLGLGLQESLEFLYSQRPDLQQFLQWVNDHAVIPPKEDEIKEAPLTAADLQHWNDHGFVVLKEAVSVQQYEAGKKAIWEFLGADPADPESWYRDHPAKNGLMLVFTQHDALHALRNSKKIRGAFEQLYGTERIYKVIDKVSFNPPEMDQYTFRGSPLHWDTSLELPIPDRFQGLLYLNDTPAEGGAFQCVPGFHNSIKQWMESLPVGTDPRKYAAEHLKPVSLTGNAGDLIIWHQALPHCASPNHSAQPRLVQYITYIPDGFEDRRVWK